MPWFSNRNAAHCRAHAYSCCIALCCCCPACPISGKSAERAITTSTVSRRVLFIIFFRICSPTIPRRGYSQTTATPHTTWPCTRTSLGEPSSIGKSPGHHGYQSELRCVSLCELPPPSPAKPPPILTQQLAHIFPLHRPKTMSPRERIRRRRV